MAASTNPSIPFIVKDENITVYELEANDQYNPSTLSEEEIGKINKANAKFEREVLQPILIDKAMPCQCMMPIITERARRRASLLVNPQTPPGQLQLRLEQVDIDQKDFVAIVNEDNGYYKDVRFVANHCKNCGEMHFWGDLSPIGALIARAFVDYDTTRANRMRRQEAMRELIENTPTPPDGQPMFMFENTETGERTSADEVMAQLAGGDLNNLKGVTVEGEEP